MKFELLSFILPFLLLPFTFLLADSIIDSVYSVPQLDGSILYSPDNNPVSMNNFTYCTSVGDLGVPLAPGPEPNSCNRSFLSFELPEIPKDYDIDSVLIRLYQFESFCNGSSIGGVGFPEWNIPGGDTVKCLMSHIDYGFELDYDDWEKGDIGNPYTYTHNVGTITDSGIEGHRWLNVTDCIWLDYALNRTLSQYRIAFEVNTDGDSLRDAVGFTTYESDLDFYQPKLFIYLSSEVNVQEEEFIEPRYKLDVYPNPFNPETTIYYELTDNSKVMVKIYNVKGQLIDTLVNHYQEAGQHSVSWNAVNQSSGIYFYKLHTGAQTATGKCLLLK